MPVLGWRHDWFPAFYTRSSGLPVPHRVESAAEVAGGAGHRARPDTGVLVTAPIPEAAELAARRARRGAGRGARATCEASGIVGAAVTPFVLGRIAAATEGRSIPANLALAENNARVAAEIAVASPGSVAGGEPALEPVEEGGAPGVGRVVDAVERDPVDPGERVATTTDPALEQMLARSRLPARSRTSAEPWLSPRRSGGCVVAGRAPASSARSSRSACPAGPTTRWGRRAQVSHHARSAGVGGGVAPVGLPRFVVEVDGAAPCDRPSPARRALGPGPQR